MRSGKTKPNQNSRTDFISMSTRFAFNRSLLFSASLFGCSIDNVYDMRSTIVKTVRNALDCHCFVCTIYWLRDFKNEDNNRREKNGKLVIPNTYNIHIYTHNSNVMTTFGTMPPYHRSNSQEISIENREQKKNWRSNHKIHTQSEWETKEGERRRREATQTMISCRKH